MSTRTPFRPNLETPKCLQMLALKAEDGTTIFICSDALADDRGGPLRVRIARLAWTRVNQTSVLDRFELKLIQGSGK